MTTKSITITEAFDLIETISPSENWDLIFEQKLQNASFRNSRKKSKFNLAIIILVFINVGFILNSFRTETTKKIDIRTANFKTISDELLSSNN
jgi:hypothetical protein